MGAPGVVTGASSITGTQRSKCLGKGRISRSDERLGTDGGGGDESVAPEMRVRLEVLLRRYDGAFSQTEHDLGHASTVKHRIDTGDGRPFRQVLRRYHVVMDGRGHRRSGRGNVVGWDRGAVPVRMGVERSDGEEV